VSAGAATLDASVGAVLLYNATGKQCYEYNTTAGCATTASPTSGRWGVDYSQQASAAIAFTDIAVGGTNTQFTSAGNPVGKNFVGNLIRITGGTGFTVQTVEVVSTSGTTATVDRTLGGTSLTGGTGNLGGCLLTPGFWGGVHVANNEVHIKSGTYSMTSSTSNVAAGRVTMTNGSGSNRPTRMVGYGTKRIDNGTMPLIQASGISGVTMITAAARTVCENLEIDGNSLGTMTGTSSGQWVNSKIHRCVTGLTGAVAAERCFATSNGTGFNMTVAGSVSRCVVTANTTTGIVVQAAVCIVDTVIAANTGATVDGISASGGAGGHVINCTITGNGRDGVRHSNPEYGYHVVDCIITSNGGYGVNSSSITSTGLALRNNAYYNNTSGVFNNTPLINQSPITLTGDPFTNAAGGDYSLNNTAGAGAACRAAGLLGAFSNGTTTGYRDLGAVQHQDSGGGGGGLALPVGRPI
jgi:hypothetical protein